VDKSWPDVPGLDEEFRLWKRGYTHIAGIDEVGRGALAGPVVAAAVILPRCDEFPALCELFAWRRWHSASVLSHLRQSISSVSCQRQKRR
jgi:hypothetical protein